MAITISPTAITLAPGESTVFTAHPSGGEAIRLFVDWSIQEGRDGGTLAASEENTNGNFSAKFTAPLNGRGPYHVIASIRGFPSVKAVATIN